MNTTKTEITVLKKKRNRITKTRIVNQGEIVAKSHVIAYHKMQRTARQVITYDMLSYRILKRELIFVESEENK